MKNNRIKDIFSTLKGSRKELARSMFWINISFYSKNITELEQLLSECEIK